jgi:hypothetical protein
MYSRRPERILVWLAAADIHETEKEVAISSQYAV